MGKTNFVTHYNEGDESVMSLDGITATKITFNNKTREIFIVYEEIFKYTEEELNAMSAKGIKELVLENGGTYTNKKSGITFLMAIEA